MWYLSINIAAKGILSWTENDITLAVFIFVLVAGLTAILPMSLSNMEARWKTFCWLTWNCQTLYCDNIWMKLMFTCNLRVCDTATMLKTDMRSTKSESHTLWPADYQNKNRETQLQCTQWKSDIILTSGCPIPINLYSNFCSCIFKIVYI